MAVGRKTEWRMKRKSKLKTNIGHDEQNNQVRKENIETSESSSQAQQTTSAKAVTETNLPHPPRCNINLCKNLSRAKQQIPIAKLLLPDTIRQQQTLHLFLVHSMQMLTVLFSYSGHSTFNRITSENRLPCQCHGFMQNLYLLLFLSAAFIRNEMNMNEANFIEKKIRALHFVCKVVVSLIRKSPNGPNDVGT